MDRLTQLQDAIDSVNIEYTTLEERNIKSVSSLDGKNVYK